MIAFYGFLIFLLTLLILFAVRTPVGVALAMVAFFGTAIFVSTASIGQLATISFSVTSNFIIVVVPLFILMGEVLSAAGIGADLFRAAEIWFRKIPGALAVATIWACAIF